MTEQTNPVALEIGKALRNARLEKGYKSRQSLVDTRPLKGMLSSEGLRKIESGERIPRLENLRCIAKVLGIGEEKIRELETKALRANVERVAKQAGNAIVSIQIEGEPLLVGAHPPKWKTELFVRDTVNELVEVVGKYGVMDVDLEHFRRTARSILLRKLK